MHKENEDGSFISGHIVDAAHEETATRNGWVLVRPPIPEPEPERAVLTLEERVAALEALLAPIKPDLLNEGKKRKR